MKVLIVLAFVAVATAAKNPAALAGGGGLMGADTSKWESFKCRDGVLGPSDNNMGEIGACAAQYGPGKMNPDCTFFCQAKALGVLNNQGVPTAGIYGAWVDRVVPQHGALAKAWFNDCMEKYGKFIDKNDATCKFAKLFGDCTWSVQPNLTCPK